MADTAVREEALGYGGPYPRAVEPLTMWPRGPLHPEVKRALADAVGLVVVITLIVHGVVAAWSWIVAHPNALFVAAGVLAVAALAVAFWPRR